MGKYTIRECLIAALELRGAEAVESKSRKYVTYHLDGRYYFIGKAGALRTCARHSSSDSVSLEGPTRNEWIAFGHAELLNREHAAKQHRSAGL